LSQNKKILDTLADNTTNVSEFQDISIQLIVRNLKHTTINNSRGVDSKIEDMGEEDSGNKIQGRSKWLFLPYSTETN
jgi:hypothetical protein